MMPITTHLAMCSGSREAELKAIEQVLWGSGPGSVKAAIGEVREFATEQLQRIRGVLQSEVKAARFELSKHVDQIVMRPVARGDQRHYLAEGDWKLAGKYEGRPGAALRNLEMVAGGRNVVKLTFQATNAEAA